MIETGDRNQDADRDHRARHRVAQPDGRARKRHQTRTAGAYRIGQQQRERHRTDAGDGGQREAVDRQPDETLAELRVTLGERPLQQHRRRHDEAGRQRQHTGDGDAPAGSARQRMATRTAAGATAVVEARTTAAEPLGQQQHGDEAEQQRGQLRRGDAVAEREPGAVDAGGEGLHAEIAHRTVIGQRFHQRQRHAGGDRRPCQRQRDAEEGFPCALPQHARRLVQSGGALDQRLPGQQVNVGIEHGDEHAGRTADGAHVGEPVVAALPAEGIAQRGLHRADELQQVGIGIGHHVGGCGQRQHHGPFEHAAAGELPHHRRPGGRHTDHRGTQPDPKTEPQRAGDVLRQHGRRQVRPGVAGAAAEQIEQYRQHRCGHQQRQQQCDQRQGMRTAGRQVGHAGCSGLSYRRPVRSRSGRRIIIESDYRS